MNTDGLKQMAQEYIEQGKDKAQEFLDDGGKMDELLEAAEKKLSEIPKAGEYFAEVPRMIALLKDHIEKDYEAPTKALVAIIAALLYLINPKDIIPDKYLGVGQLDDAAVIAAAIAISKKDLDDYAAWKDGIA